MFHSSRPFLLASRLLRQTPSRKKQMFSSWLLLHAQNYCTEMLRARKPIWTRRGPCSIGLREWITASTLPITRLPAIITRCRLVHLFAPYRGLDILPRRKPNMRRIIETRCSSLHVCLTLQPICLQKTGWPVLMIWEYLLSSGTRSIILANWLVLQQGHLTEALIFTSLCTQY